MKKPGDAGQKVAACIKSIRLAIHKMHLYSRKGEAIVKTIIFWTSMIFGLRGIADDPNRAIVGSGFLMYSLAMIVEYVFSAIERKSYTKVLPVILSITNSYIVVVSASNFTEVPIEPRCLSLMDLTYLSLAVITIDSILLLVEDADGLDNG